MAYTTIDDPSEYFQTKIYAGSNNNNVAFTFDGNSDLQPDWLWIKNRTEAQHHAIFDSTRGAVKRLLASDAGTETTENTNLDSFDSDGFTLDEETIVLKEGDNFVAWAWKANGGSRTTFTESGNNPAGGHQANTTAGFSIVDYTGTGAAGTLAHGLGAVPAWFVVKGRDVGNHWRVYHHKNTSAPETESFKLNDNNATADFDGWWNDTAPTSSVFTVGNDDNTNENDSTYIAYCFTPIQGFSEFGSYKGTAAADGPFVYTGFKPALVICKGATNASSWNLHDNKRQAGNDGSIPYLKANNTTAELSANNMDILSNGFKLRTADNDWNGDNTYIYMAWAENPFVSSEGVPTTAR